MLTDRKSGDSRKGGLGGWEAVIYNLTVLIGKLRGIVQIFKRVTEDLKVFQKEKKGRKVLIPRKILKFKKGRKSFDYSEQYFHSHVNVNIGYGFNKNL